MIETAQEEARLEDHDDSFSETYIVLMRADSCGPIQQQEFETYEDAEQFYEKMLLLYHFVKLCMIVLDSRDISYE